MLSESVRIWLSEYSNLSTGISGDRYISCLWTDGVRSVSSIIHINQN